MTGDPRTLAAALDGAIEASRVLAAAIAPVATTDPSYRRLYAAAVEYVAALRAVRASIRPDRPH
jgi:hypothetical protein